MICYYSCPPAKLISRYVTLKVPLEKFHNQQSLGSTPATGEVNQCDNTENNRSPNDFAECITVHMLFFQFVKSNI